MTRSSCMWLCAPRDVTHEGTRVSGSLHSVYWPRRLRRARFLFLVTSRDLRRPIDLGGVLVDHLSHDADLRAGLVPLPLLDRLPHAGQRLHAVAGVEAGG